MPTQVVDVELSPDLAAHMHDFGLTAELYQGKGAWRGGNVCDYARSPSGRVVQASSGCQDNTPRS
jgi:hypothetical protein